MQKPKILILLTILAFGTVFVFNPMSTPTQPVKAWSGNTHGWLSEVAIRMGPEPLRSGLMDELQFFYDHSVEPDSIRSALETADPIAYAQEEPRHFVDYDVRPELYGNATHHPQPVFETTKVNFGQDPRGNSDYQLGTACWAVENWTIQLTEDLQVYDWDSDEILMDMCMLAHYVQDSWMPFHAVSFWDGQRLPSSGVDAGLFYDGSQLGIHGEVENYMIQQRCDEFIHSMLDNVSGVAVYSNPYMESLNGILTGEGIARQILAINDDLGIQFQTSAWRTYFEDNFIEGEGNHSKRLINASIATANVWFTAFVDAGIVVDPNAPTTTTTTTEPEITTTTTTTEETAGLNSAEFIVLLSLSTISLVVTRRKRK